MTRKLLLLAIVGSASAAATGCSLCQSHTDHAPSYYGGVTGDWAPEYGRAGSYYAGTAYIARPTATPATPEPEEIEAQPTPGSRTPQQLPRPALEEPADEPAFDEDDLFDDGAF